MIMYRDLKYGLSTCMGAESFLLWRFVLFLEAKTYIHGHIDGPYF